MNALDLIALLGAAWAALLVADRLRLINWHTTKPLYVALYVTHMLWALGIVYSIFTQGVSWPQLCGLAAMFCWLAVTKHNWLDGVPEEATKPGHLGVPELDHFR